MSCEGQNPECTPLKAPKRNHYFYGKLLEDFHFCMETKYQNDKRWLLNRLSLGYGVLCGLKVTTRDGKLWVSSGIAIDACGREIIVPEPFWIDPWKEPDPTCGNTVSIDRTKPVYLCLVYRECLTDPMPVLVTDCEAQNQTQCGTIVEGYKWQLTNEQPTEWPNQPSEALCAALKAENAIERLKALCTVFAGDQCQPTGTAPCVILVKIELNFEAKSIESIDNCSVRPFVVSNETLFEMILCLAGGGAGVPGPKGDTGPQGETGPRGPEGQGLETGLVQISALSWIHQGKSQQQFGTAQFSLLNEQGQLIEYRDIDLTTGQLVEKKIVQALVIGFSGNITTKCFSPYPLGATPEFLPAFPILEVMALTIPTQFGPLVSSIDILNGFVWVSILGSIYPVTQIETDPNDKNRIIKATTTLLGSNQEMPDKGVGIAFIPIGGLLGLSRLSILSPLILVRLRGDFILDVNDLNNPRAIDAEFVRGELPSGARPKGKDYGVQGGTFESWFSYDNRTGILPTAGLRTNPSLNNASIMELALVPEIGFINATAIVTAREQKSDRRFKDYKELIGIGILNKKAVDSIRKHIQLN